MFIVSLYATNSRRASDCLPDFFATREEAIKAACQEICRVTAIEPEDRHPTIDWARRYSVRKVR